MAAVDYHYGRFPPERLGWEALIPLIGPTYAAVARYDGTLSAMPNANVLLAPLTTQEAVLSSRIEGTQTTFDEVLRFEAGAGDTPLTPNQEADVFEVINYRKALRAGVQGLEDLPLSQRLIKDTHRILLQGVRGHGKSPGEYRRTPNWIGPPGCSVGEARFVPISAEKLPDAMSSWEAYMHAEPKDRLVQLAILHAELEALHPFLDGNGRLGRMFVPLFMVAFKVISKNPSPLMGEGWGGGDRAAPGGCQSRRMSTHRGSEHRSCGPGITPTQTLPHRGGGVFRSAFKVIQAPVFYVSAYLESHRDEYYQRLLAVSQDDNWTDWCAFFLRALKAQAEENEKRAKSILSLYQDMKNHVVDVTHSQYAIQALDWIFQHPIFRASDLVAKSGIPTATARRFMTGLRDGGVLVTVSEPSGRRSAVYAFRSLLDVAEGAAVF